MINRLRRSRAADAMTSDHIVFMHIPKAAGQTLHAILAREYGPAEILRIEGGIGETHPLDPERARRARLIVGHVDYGFHKQLDGTTAYITMLRDPVARVLSLCRYVASNPHHRLHNEVTRQTLGEFVSGQAGIDEIENGQIRQIAGLTGGTPDQSTLEQAKSNLSNAFAAVGIVERFDESVILFRRRFGWRPPFYVARNITRETSRESLTPEVVNIVRARNALDEELYRFASQLFQEDIRSGGMSFALEVATFRMLNVVARVYRSHRSRG
jgi:Sulfotransferase family